MSFTKLIQSKEVQTERAFLLASRVDEHVEELAETLAIARVNGRMDKSPTLHRVVSFLHTRWFDILLEQEMSLARADATAMLLRDLSSAVMKSYTTPKSNEAAKVKPKAKGKSHAG